MRIKLGAIAALLALGSLLPLTPVDAAPAEEHCAVRVVGQKPSGELITSPMVCRSTRAAALIAVGAVSTSGYTAQSTFTIGTHFDGAGFSGSSFNVVGSSCSGGWLNLNSSWINRVSSTLNGCNVVTHYDGYSLTGAWEMTFGGGGNLGALNNRANSIQYSS